MQICTGTVEPLLKHRGTNCQNKPFYTPLLQPVKEWYVPDMKICIDRKKGSMDQRTGKLSLVFLTLHTNRYVTLTVHWGAPQQTLKWFCLEFLFKNTRSTCPCRTHWKHQVSTPDRLVLPLPPSPHCIVLLQNHLQYLAQCLLLANFLSWVLSHERDSDITTPHIDST